MFQLTLDLPPMLTPETCQYREDVTNIDRVLCHRNGTDTYVECHKSFCGEPPHCSWDEPDNSPDACAKRLEWMKNHKKGTEE